MEHQRAADLLRFFRVAGRLKRTVRAGWALRGIQDPESVADHTFRLCLLVLMLSGEVHPPLDRERCLAMALVHDLGESIVGDITPYDGVPVEEKHRREGEAMAHLATLLGRGEIRELWEEYQAGATPEARFVKELDRLETVLQAAEYGEEQGVELGEFRGMGERLALPVTRALFSALGEA
ncbi:MAG TPA: HD domain-containing protein [Longimicrobiaceae bacterium]|nr:HD domain-containing protein [Longimicrobiaceae bacterium]